MIKYIPIYYNLGIPSGLKYDIMYFFKNPEGMK